MSATDTGKQSRSASWPGAVRAPRRPEVARRPRARLALRARWHADILDRALADGASPQADPLIATRAAQLTGARCRGQLADGLARVRRVAAEGRDPAGLTAAVAADRHEVMAAGPELAALEHRLRDGAPIDPRGAAIVRLLLCDGTGPLYDPVGAGSVARHARAAAAALRQAPR
jgi:hypothetical protein